MLNKRNLDTILANLMADGYTEDEARRIINIILLSL